MKKLLLIPFTLMLACGAAFSQGTIKNNSYFNLSWVRPIMDYGKIEGNESPKNMLQYYKEKSGGDLQHYSGAINVGANFYIHPVGWIIEGFKPGICVDFIDLSADYYRFPDAVVDKGVADTADYSDLTASYSLNVGVVATISPTDKFYIDLTAKFCPTFAVNYFKIPGYLSPTSVASWDIYEYRMPGVEYGGYDVSLNGAPNVASKEAEDTGIGWGLDYAFGLDLRYSKFSIGCEWSFGNLHYSYDTWADQKVNNQKFKLKLGLSFE